MTHLVNRRTVRIEWGQCDPAGVIFYPQYMVMFNASNDLLFARTGLSPTAMRQKYGILGTPMVEERTRFLIACWFDDEITIESEVVHWGRSSFIVNHRVLRPEGLAVDCNERRVWVTSHARDPRRMKPAHIPAEVIASLSDPTGSTRCA